MQKKDQILKLKKKTFFFTPNYMQPNFLVIIFGASFCDLKKF